MSASHPFAQCIDQLEVGGETYQFYNLTKLSDSRYERLPYSVRVLLESAVRNCDNFLVQETDVKKILDWECNQSNATEVPFKPSRVILQDFTGVPAVVDFAAMRDAVKRLGGDPEKINPICPADLVIDHSVQVDVARSLLNTSAPNPGGGRAVKEFPSQHGSSPPLHVSKNSNNHFSQGRRSPKRTTNIHPTQSRIRLRSAKTNSPLCERSVSGKCEAQFCSSPLQPNIGTFGSATPLLSNTSTSLANNIQMPRRAPCRGAAGCCRQACCRLPGNENKVCDPLCPFHLKKSVGAEALQHNQDMEFERNKERFNFLKWGAKALKNMLIVPPGSGIVHQVNLEYLARLVFCEDKWLYPDSLVGTDSHTTMINGLGVVGWGVGGIEAEAVMLGQAISMVLPEVIGYKIYGTLDPKSTSTDVVLTITKHLRQIGVVGKFVEFFGPGVADLSLADRATISNMCPEYGATVGYFPADAATISYLTQTGRPSERVAYIESYLKANKLFRDFTKASEDPVFTKVVELDLGTVVPCCSGPKRPHDKVPVSEMMADFRNCLDNRIGFKGFAIPSDKQSTVIPFVFEGQEYTLTHGDVVIAAITSCTNTSNPSVMLGAGLLCKNAVESGLGVKPYIKTSLSPGSGVVTYYLNESGVTPFMEKLGFDIVGYGCMTCIGNSGPLPEPVNDAIDKGDLVCCGVLSGNRNFEGRIHPLTRANYLASPLLVVAYALAGTVSIDFETTPLGNNAEGKPVFLRDIWPTRAQIQEVEKQVIVPALYNKVYGTITDGNEKWNSLAAPTSQLYPWDSTSTYIKSPPFFEGMTPDAPGYRSVENAYALLNLGDSVTTDHISPAGSISRTSAAARYLASRGLTPRDFNSYGARRGNDDVMSRGTFANIRLVNKLVSKAGPRTVHVPSNEEMDVFDAAERYKSASQQVIILAGKEYGSGSSRDWAAKGPYLLGVRAVLAESYERIHRSNLVGMGLIPLQYQQGETADSLGLTGREQFTIDVPADLTTGQLLTVKVSGGKQFQVVARFDTEVELEYFRNGGILNYMIRKML